MRPCNPSSRAWETYVITPRRPASAGDDLVRLPSPAKFHDAGLSGGAMMAPEREPVRDFSGVIAGRGAAREQGSLIVPTGRVTGVLPAAVIPVHRSVGTGEVSQRGYPEPCFCPPLPLPPFNPNGVC